MSDLPPNYEEHGRSGYVPDDESAAIASVVVGEAALALCKALPEFLDAEDMLVVCALVVKVQRPVDPAPWTIAMVHPNEPQVFTALAGEFIDAVEQMVKIKEADDGRA